MLRVRYAVNSIHRRLPPGPSLIAPLFPKITKCCLKWAEPRFEHPPLLQAGATDGLANLLGARSSDRTWILMECQAGGIERQTEEIEHLSDFAFRIIYQILVNHAVNQSWLDDV